MRHFRRLSRGIVLLGCLLAVSTSLLWAYQIETGTYTVGVTPADDRTISLADSSILPVFLSVKCASAVHPVWAITDTIPNALAWGSSSNQSNNTIQAFGAGTLELGTNTSVQPASTTCYYLALGDNGHADLEVGTYTGNGVDDRAITGIGFQPAFVLIRHTTGGSTVTVWRTAAHVGDLTSMISGANLANAVQSLDSNGFTLGTDASVNSDTVVYAYVAIKAVATYNDSGTFTGNVTDDRAIATINTPLFSLFKVAGAGATACSRFGSVGDLSWTMNNVAEAANQIQAHTTSGITIGSATCVNQNSTSVYWWASKNPIYATAQKIRRVLMNF